MINESVNILKQRTIRETTRLMVKNVSNFFFRIIFLPSRAENIYIYIACIVEPFVISYVVKSFMYKSNYFTLLLLFFLHYYMVQIEIGRNEIVCK